MRRAIDLVRRNLLVVAVIVLAMGASAYAGSRIGSKDLKGMRFVDATKTIKDGQRKNVKANCRKGEVVINVGYAITPELQTDPTPVANVVSLFATKRSGKGRGPDQVLLDVSNPGNSGRSFQADAFGWCLKK